MIPASCLSLPRGGGGGLIGRFGDSEGDLTIGGLVGGGGGSQWM